MILAICCTGKPRTLKASHRRHRSIVTTLSRRFEAHSPALNRIALFARAERSLFEPATPYNGRAKTSAHLLAASFRLASPCAGFEPLVRIRPTTPASLGFDLVFAASAETIKMLPRSRIMFLGVQTFHDGGWDMAQTRRMGMQNERAHRPKAPRFSPYRNLYCCTNAIMSGA